MIKATSLMGMAMHEFVWGVGGEVVLYYYVIYLHGYSYELRIVFNY